jgi:hypothetical protein
MNHFEILKQKQKKENAQKIHSRNTFISFAIILILIFVIFLNIESLEKKGVEEIIKIEHSEELVNTPKVEEVDSMIFDDQSEIIAEAIVENKKESNLIVEEVAAKQEVKPDPLRNLNNYERVIFKECKKLDMNIPETAFVLANANHETAEFKYLKEIDGENQAIKLGYKGGRNWYGRGLIQLTHITNYQQWSKWTGRDLVNNPDLLITDIQLSAHIACSGIKNGSFTSKGKLVDYKGNWYNARALVNGDKDYKAGCNQQKCWTVGTKIKDLTNKYIDRIK